MVQLKLPEVLGKWRKRIREAIQAGENLDEILLQAERELKALGFPSYIAILRQEAMRARLLGPTLGLPTPPSRPAQPSLGFPGHPEILPPAAPSLPVEPRPPFEPSPTA